MKNFHLRYHRVSLLFQLPWGTFLTPVSRLRAFLSPGEGTQKEAVPSSCGPELPSYSLLSTFPSAIFPPWAPPNSLSNLFPMLKNWG